MASTAELGILLKARDEASGVLNNVKNLALGMGAAFVGAAVLAVKAAEEEQVHMTKLMQAVSGTKDGWDVASGAIEDFLGNQRAVSGFSRGELADALALITAQTSSYAEAQKRLHYAEDIARGTNLDLYAASKLVGKVTEENINVFGRMGIVVKKGTTETELFALVQDKFGGQSAAFASTLEGQWGILQDTFHQVLATLGTLLLPMLTQGVGIVLEFVNSFYEGGRLEAIGSAFTTIVAILTEMFGVITGSAPEAGGTLKGIVGPETASFIMGGLAFIRESFKTAMQAISGVLNFLKENWDAVAFAMKVVAVTVIIPAFIAWSVAAIGAATATIIALAPVLIPIAAIGAAAFLLYKLWNENFGGIQEKTKAVIDFLYGAFDAFGSFFAGLWNNLRGPVETAIGFIMAPINSLISLVQTALGWVQTLSGASANSQTYNAQAGGMTTGGGEYVPVYAEGTAYVPRTGLAMLHQGEAVVPANQNGGGWGGSIHVEVHGSVIGITDLEARVRQAVTDGYRAGGFRGISR